MKKAFRIISILGVCLVSLLGLAYLYKTNLSPIKTCRSEATYVEYSDSQKLSQHADLIIIAKPEKDFEQLKPTIKYNVDGRIEDAYTVSNLKTLKVIKGDSSIKNIDVLEPAVLMKDGLSGRTLQITGEYYTVMKKDVKYLLYLKKVEGQDLYSIISLEYGKYNLDNKDIDEKNTTEKSHNYKELKDKINIKMNDIYKSVD